LPAELDRLSEELLKHATAQTSTCFGEDAVVRRRYIEVVTEEPAIAQVQADLVGQAPLGGDAVEVADEQHLEDDDRVDRGLAGVAVVGTAKRAHEGEVDAFGDTSQQMVAGYKPIKRELIVKLGLELTLSHHGLASSQLGGHQRPISIILLIRSSSESSATAPFVSVEPSWDTFHVRNSRLAMVKRL
jgi:hypothetical protein